MVTLLAEVCSLVGLCYFFLLYCSFAFSPKMGIYIARCENDGKVVRNDVSHVLNELTQTRVNLCAVENKVAYRRYWKMKLTSLLLLSFSFLK